MPYSYALSFIEGVLTFVSPCILPLLPVYFSYLAGSTAEEGTAGYAPVKNTAVFVAGFTLVFVLMGAAATSIGFFLKEHIDVFRKVSGIVMVVFGIFFLGIVRVPFLDRTVKLDFRLKGEGLAPSAVFGIVFAFGWSPCTGPFLGTALLLAGSTATVWKGVLMLLLYSAGLGIPFLLASVAFNKFREGTGWLARHHKGVRYVSGAVLILTGILVYTNVLYYAAAWMR